MSVQLQRLQLLRPSTLARCRAWFGLIVALGFACGDSASAAPTAILPTHADLPYAAHARNVLDLFLAESDEPTPVVLYIHGGGFRNGDKSRLKQSDLRAYLTAGYSVASLNYRLTDVAPAPAAYLDCGRAIQFLRHHARQWNLDPKLIASTGGSAGAGTSLWLALHDDLADPDSDDPISRESTRLTCVAVTNGQSSYDPRFAESIGLPRPNFENHSFFLPFYGITAAEIDSPKAIARYESMAPITHLTEDDPPALLDYGRPNLPVNDQTDKSFVVHHPLFGIALKTRMDKLGIACIVQYQDLAGKKIRHTPGESTIKPVEFISQQFKIARQANKPPLRGN